MAVRKLVLRAKPSDRAEVIRTLGVNNQVEKIGETEGWFNVRQPSTGAVGWVISRHLKTLPVILPQGVPAKKKPGPSRQKAQPDVDPDFI